MGLVALLVVLGAGAASYFLLVASDDEAEAQTIRFQKPDDVGADPFTKPADVKGEDRVKLAGRSQGDSDGEGAGTGEGPFGGSGSNRVCDRELLIRALSRRPDRLKEWARVLGVEANESAVARYIRQLRPVTLTRDTRVTNHTFEGGRAVPSQDILQRGTAVLADGEGKPVVRCRCGNPLLKPIQTPATAKCVGCPENYDTSNVCRAGNRCWRRYPSPPPVKGSSQTARCPQQFTGVAPTGSEFPFRVQLNKAPLTCEEAGQLLIDYFKKVRSTGVDSSQLTSVRDGWRCSTGASFSASACTKGDAGVTAIIKESGPSQGGETPGPAPEDDSAEGAGKCPQGTRPGPDRTCNAEGFVCALPGSSTSAMPCRSTNRP